MTRDIILYIGGELADLTSDSLILFNYALSDFTNPTAVKNSYSQSITLPGTHTNDAIFGHIYRTDHLTTTGFSPMVRTPFELRDANGARLESGYLKLTDIVTERNGQHSYKVSLFGGLGAFIYSLTYGSTGDKKTLADLTYLNGGGVDELSFNINGQQVADAWANIGTGAPSQKWHVINFAPCYNGAPNDFDTDKVLVKPSVLGWPSNHPDDGSYHTHDGYVLAELGQEYDEWRMRDLRSYLQRPVLRVRAVIEACCNAANNGNWTVNLDSAFFSNNNPYYDKTWMALDMLSSDTSFSQSSSAITVSYPDTYIRRQGTATLTPSPVPDPGKCTAIINSKLEFSESGSWYLYCVGQQLVYETYILVQLLACDADDVVVGGSPLICLCDNDAELSSPEDVARASGYTPLWDEYGTTVFGTVVGGFWSTALQQSVTAYSVNRWKLAYCAVTRRIQGSSETWIYNPLIFGSRGDVTSSHTFSGRYTSNPSRTDVIQVESFDGLRTGAHITKAMLLGKGGTTPADFLLSYCKTFGLMIVANPDGKTIDIRTRNTHFDGLQYDWNVRVNREKDITTSPVAAASQWYELSHEVVEGAHAKEYADEYGREYGSMRVDTGYEFDSEVKQLLEGNVFKTAVESLDMSRDYADPKVGSATYRNWQTSAVKAVYYKTLDDTKELNKGNIVPDGRTYWSNILNNADCFPKVQFCNAEGQDVEAYGTLLFYGATAYSGYNGTYYLTDDWSLMYEMNGETPCWLIEGAGSHSRVVTPPQFSRAMRSADLKQLTRQLEFTTPKQLYNGYVNSYLGSQALYPKFWENYISDIYDADTRVMTCHVDLRGIAVNADLLRHFYAIDGGIWVLNKITNYSLTTLDTTECEFVKVKDVDNYTDGQDLT